MTTNPNSLKNLEGNRCTDQNYYTRVAAQFNWLRRSVLAAISQLTNHSGSAVHYAKEYKSNWLSFSVERRSKISEIETQQEICRAELKKLEVLILELPTTPLRSPEAREAKLARRREARKIKHIEVP